MHRTNFTDYDQKPPEMINYLRYNGPHFTKKLAMFAASLMSKEGNPIEIMEAEEVDSILASYGVKLKNNQLYDYLYVANMTKADFVGESIEDDVHFAKHIKAVIDDTDAYDGIVFNRWYADMCATGRAIDWTKML